jgi:hypothetical protein
MMSIHYIQHEVEELRQDPQEGEWIDLLVGVDEDRTDEAKDRLEEESATIERELAFGLFLVQVPETAINAICNIEVVESVELNDSLELLDQGNSYSPRGPTQ